MINYPKVAVVIIHWNKVEYLQKFLPSVVANDYPNLEIVLADNHSSDESIAFVKENYPQITIVQNGYNYGYAGGYNHALKHVEADYYVLLNNDIEVTANWIAPVIEAMQADETIAAAQPKMLQYNNKKLFEYAGAAGGYMDSFGYVFCKGRLFETCEEDKNQYQDIEQVFWATGACLFIKAKAFHEVGGFDAHFFAHMEEVDLCWRLQLRGYKIISVPTSTVYHVGGGTLNKQSEKKTYLNFRNSLIMLLKNLPAHKVWWLVPFRHFLDLMSSGFFLLNGFPKHSLAIHKAHYHFAKHFFTWLKLRKKTQATIKNKKLHGLYANSVVWKHFVEKKQYFTEL
ncbi:MAG: glycosyltransferase family 2 protein [Bacteroidota bacterium]